MKIVLIQKKVEELSALLTSNVTDESLSLIRRLQYLNVRQKMNEVSGIVSNLSNYPDLPTFHLSQDFTNNDHSIKQELTMGEQIEFNPNITSTKEEVFDGEVHIRENAAGTLPVKQWTREELFGGLRTTGDWNLTGENIDKSSGDQDVFNLAVMNNQVKLDDHGFVKVYIKGKCSRSQATVGVWWGEQSGINFGKKIERKEGEFHSTWTADILSAIEALEVARQLQIKQLRVYTRCWSLVFTLKTKEPGWKRMSAEGGEYRFKGFDDLAMEKLCELMHGINVEWIYTKGEEGIRKAEVLAVRAKL